MIQCAFYPGSFDPPTLGHLDVIKRGLKLFDKLVVGVGVHTSKISLFTASERVAMLEHELSLMNGASEVITFQALTVEVARKQGAHIILRGLRNSADFDYENQLASMNQTLANDIETVFMAASPSLSHITSTLVRQITMFGGDVSPFVSPAIAEHLRAKQKKS